MHDMTWRRCRQDKLARHRYEIISGPFFAVSRASAATLHFQPRCRFHDVDYLPTTRDAMSRYKAISDMPMPRMQVSASAEMPEHSIGSLVSVATPPYNNADGFPAIDDAGHAC